MRGRAIVVDDNRDHRAMIGEALAAAGFEVSLLEDGLELLEVLRIAPPRYFQLVVADQRMPGLFGTEVLARTGSRKTPFVIVTGDDATRVREDAMKYGAAAVLKKPVDVPKLLAAIDEAVHDDDTQVAS